MVAVIPADAAAVVTAVASAVASVAITYIAHRIGSFVDTVEDNEKRSTRNQDFLFGTEYREGVIDHIEQLGEPEREDS